VLGPIDLVVSPGEVLVLTGPSGAGKSTLLQLLAGFVVPSSGQWRRSKHHGFAWMDQRPLLIMGSLADNLRLANPQASEASMRHALSRADLDDLLSELPDGLDTGMGERGLGLSAGQAQRLALARIFLSASSLVLLDEPTASLDEDSEAWIIRALKALVEEGRTLVIATHHPALMAMTNRRLVLDENGWPAAATGERDHG
jgi:ATP-binding cassette subfamily C protein CydD